GTFSASHASCTACSVVGPAMPSIVVICLPASSPIGITHERFAWPSTCTVHAPHCAMPQPNFVPVRPSLSRSTHKSGVSLSAVTSTRLPLTVIFMSPQREREAESRRHARESIRLTERHHAGDLDVDDDVAAVEQVQPEAGIGEPPAPGAVVP